MAEFGRSSTDTMVPSRMSSLWNSASVMLGLIAAGLELRHLSSDSPGSSSAPAQTPPCRPRASFTLAYSASSAILALTSFPTIVAGRPVLAVKRIVPGLVSYPTSSALSVDTVVPLMG